MSLIKDWLTKYKFKNWEKSESHKQKRAGEIAKQLNNHILMVQVFTKIFWNRTST